MPHLVRARLNRFGGGPENVIEVDGVDISKSVRSLKFKRKGSGRNKVKVGFTLPDFDFEGEAEIRITEPLHEALVALGWTPPAQ